MGGAADTWQPSAFTPAALSTPRAHSRFTSCACALAILNRHPQTLSAPAADAVASVLSFWQTCQAGGA